MVHVIWKKNNNRYSRQNTIPISGYCFGEKLINFIEVYLYVFYSILHWKLGYDPTESRKNSTFCTSFIVDKVGS